MSSETQDSFQVVSSHLLAQSTTFHAAVGSILFWQGGDRSAIVNAANEGGTGGFGVDEAINRACSVLQMKVR